MDKMKLDGLRAYFLVDNKKIECVVTSELKSMQGELVVAVMLPKTRTQLVYTPLKGMYDFETGDCLYTRHRQSTSLVI